MRGVSIRLLVIAAVASSIAGCSPGEAGGDTAAPALAEPSHTLGPGSNVVGVSVAPSLEGSFDVGGHQLYIRCVGTGSPTIVYLHGYIFDPSGGSGENAGTVPSLLEDRYRVCVYDRANVGRSQAVEGPLTGSSSIRDLQALLEAARIRGPLVLVGGSFGGLLAYMYATTYPQGVSGMVLLDPNLPGFHEPGFDWRSTTEQLDQSVASRQAEALLGSEPDIPVALITVEDPDVDFVASADEYDKLKAEIREAQERFLGRFSRSELVVVDAPHYMEPVIPDRIASEITEIATASG